METQSELSYVTPSGILVRRSTRRLDPATALDPVRSRIDRRRGVILASGYEYPGRYSRWDLAFTDPPLEFVACGRDFTLRALNERGERLLTLLAPALEGCNELASLEVGPAEARGRVGEGSSFFAEEDRSRRPTVFTPLRALRSALASDRDGHLGFYGAIGYDVVFQFEPVVPRHAREAGRPDLHLFIPDALIVVDHQKETAESHEYEFSAGGVTTEGLPRRTPDVAAGLGQSGEAFPTLQCDHAAGEYAAKVERVREGCGRGDYFEIVLSQTFTRDFSGAPTALFERIQRSNPSPYEFLINLGGEQLVGASPEMFVRVEGRRVETCPIAGTARRPDSLMDEADVIRDLLHSKKDEAELTMCTDVDRNDKSRVCRTGSVRLLGRRQIETYSRLFHTVDHVVGDLREDCDGFDALLSHMWACTLTGAPKPAALQVIEDLELGPREWYGACIGVLGMNGDVNTGITIRTIHLKDGRARLRVGATLLADSEPEAEEIETRVKASAFLDALTASASPNREPEPPNSQAIQTGIGKRVLFVDHRDSFVHTLADYVRRTGAQVRTLRAGFDHAVLDAERPDLVFLSPGPGSPEEFGVAELVLACVERGIPVFGVCLGLQGIVQAFGGTLGRLPYPMHGKSSRVHCRPVGLFENFPEVFEVGRYHSLYARESALPACLQATARSEDGIIMAVEHTSLPVAAVQFHPESILTLKENLGMRLIARIVDRFARRTEGSLLVKPVGIGDVIAADR